MNEILIPLPTTITAERILIRNRRWGETSFSLAFNLSSIRPMDHAINDAKKSEVLDFVNGIKMSAEINTPRKRLSPPPRGVGVS